MARHSLPWVMLLAAALHLVGIARAIVPAQDGLKFIRIAREFGQRPWIDVVRGSDQHPLYPIGIALVEPATSAVLGHRPEAWRVAAQVVSAVAAIGLLVPLFLLTRRLFDGRTAVLAALLFAVLPLPCAIGHDTLSDALALGLFTTALWCGERALRGRHPAPALGCGLAAGLGYWTRPEIAILPATVLGVAALRAALRWSNWREWLAQVTRRSEAPPAPILPHTGRGRRIIPFLWGEEGRDERGRARGPTLAPPWGRWPALAVSVLALVGGYTLVKGEVSEKLALRRGAAIASTNDTPKAVGHWLPPGLDDPRFDFAPKEESGRVVRYGPFGAIGAAANAWAEGLGWVFAPLAVIGAWRVRARSATGRWLVGAYVMLFGVVLVRHAMGLGYLSGRHALTVVVATLPWAAAGTLAVTRRLADRLQLAEAARRRLGHAAVAVLIVAGIGLQAKPAHASRWGHRAAGRWLAAHAAEGEAVLDTRGWAGFVSGLRSYDYWHVRQALTDRRLAYVVVGFDELEATSRRAATLRALLRHAARPVAAFPGHEGGSEPEVLVYRFEHPESWEGIRP